LLFDKANFYSESNQNSKLPIFKNAK